MMLRGVLVLALFFIGFLAYDQEIVPLYSDDIPLAKSGGEIPKLTIFRPEKKLSRAVVIVCPGGGYGGRMSSYEGKEPCQKLNSFGITAVLLDYRLPNDNVMDRKEIVPLTDAQRAVQYVRENAKMLGIDPEQVGIMGFSAGGHLASTLASQYNKTVLDNPKETNLRPDFTVLVYPVISMRNELTHLGSMENLLGKSADSLKVVQFSNELQVNENTPPSYIVHGMDDGLVKVQNSLVYYARLKDNNIPAELMLYEHGQHGFGTNNRKAKVQWIDNCADWIKRKAWRIEPKNRK